MWYKLPLSIKGGTLLEGALAEPRQETRLSVSTKRRKVLRDLSAKVGMMLMVCSTPQLSGLVCDIVQKYKKHGRLSKISFADLFVEEGGSCLLVSYFFVWPKREKVFGGLKPLIWRKNLRWKTVTVRGQVFSAANSSAKTVVGRHGICPKFYTAGFSC